MYNTVYIQNNAFDFKISHATSHDGITWQMDTNVVLEPTTNLSWMSLIAAEPGVMVKEDTLYLFYSAVGDSGSQSIGLVRSIDGRNFIDTTLTATLPTDVYQNGNNYAGLSTPSPIMIGDTIYLFTDVAQFVFGDNWMQVALHQFKSHGNINKWYHDIVPIHTRNDFAWTNGNYLAEIRSITPLMDGNRLRIWYAGHNISEIDTMLNDTTNHVHFIGDELHVDDGFWGIGTSEYVFSNTTAVDEITDVNEDITIQFHQNKGVVETKNNLHSIINVYSIDGQLLYRNTFKNRLNFSIYCDGLILINVINNNVVLTKKHISSN